QAGQSGNGNTYSARRQRERTTLARNYLATKNLGAATSMPSYDADGNEIHSCDEYVYKYFYDWIKYEAVGYAGVYGFGCAGGAALRGPVAINKQLRAKGNAFAGNKDLGHSRMIPVYSKDYRVPPDPADYAPAEYKTYPDGGAQFSTQLQ